MKPLKQVFAALLMLVAGSAMAQTTISVHAAGSLRAAFGDLAKAWEQQGGALVKLTFGASGLLKERLAGGEASDLFASANVEHPQALLAAGRAERMAPFARNALCLLGAPGFSLQGQSVAQRLLDADLRVATSTPKADPAGDYAFEMFDRIESSGSAPAGSATRLKAKALQLTGGPQSAPPPADRNVYAVLLADGRADVFVTYCTNAASAKREVPALQVLPVPTAINVSALYGIALLKPVNPAAQRFMDFVLGAAGQAILATHGFAAP